jgi:hypothetical protein
VVVHIVPGELLPEQVRGGVNVVSPVLVYQVTLGAAVEVAASASRFSIGTHE